MKLFQEQNTVKREQKIVLIIIGGRGIDFLWMHTKKIQ